MDSYLSSQTVVASTLPSPDDVATCAVTEVDRFDKLTRGVEQLTEWVERLQCDKLCLAIGTGGKAATRQAPSHMSLRGRVLELPASWSHSA